MLLNQTFSSAFYQPSIKEKSNIFNIVQNGEFMNSFYSFLKRNGTNGCKVLLLFSFAGFASASLSGIELGYPRIIAENAQVDFYQADGDTYYFDAYNTDSRVFWQEKDEMPIRLRTNPFFSTLVNIDISDANNPEVLDGSLLSVWGVIPGQRSPNTLLFAANIYDLFWDTDQKIIQFILEGSSQEGAACDLGFCSFKDEVLQFTLRNFNGDWSKAFSSSASAIATVPLPAAAWLFGGAIFGLLGFQRRKV